MRIKCGHINLIRNYGGKKIYKSWGFLAWRGFNCPAVTLWLILCSTRFSQQLSAIADPFLREEEHPVDFTDGNIPQCWNCLLLEFLLLLLFCVVICDGVSGVEWSCAHHVNPKKQNIPNSHSHQEVNWQSNCPVFLRPVCQSQGEQPSLRNISPDKVQNEAKPRS